MVEKEKEIREKLQLLQFGSNSEKIDSLLGLSVLTISDGPNLEENLKEEIHNNLNPLIKGQVECNLQDACFAAITLAQLGYVSTYITYPLTTFLRHYAEDPVKFSGPMDELMNSYNLICFAIHATYALSLFKGNRDVLIHLLEHGIIKKKIRITFDFKKLHYYGKMENPYVIGIKSEKGTNL